MLKTRVADKILDKMQAFCCRCVHYGSLDACPMRVLVQNYYCERHYRHILDVIFTIDPKSRDVIHCDMYHAVALDGITEQE